MFKLKKFRNLFSLTPGVQVEIFPTTSLLYLRAFITKIKTPETYLSLLTLRYPIKDMHICRSALSCCVVTGLPYDVIKKYCVPRDMPSSFDEDFRGGDDSVFSERSDEITSDDEDINVHYNVPMPPNGFIIDDNDMIEVDEIAE